jgi:multicomponent Na+:H+ antiporter subunit E
MTEGTKAPRRSGGGPWIRAAAVRVALASVAWWILTEGSFYGPLLGTGVILAAAATSLSTIPPRAIGLRWVGLLRFVPFFVRASLVGGWDVARRALRPSLPIAPARLRIHLRLRGEPARAFLAGILCLLPGTLTVRLQDRVLLLHAIDENLPVREAVAEAEARVAGLFGEVL